MKVTELKLGDLVAYKDKVGKVDVYVPPVLYVDAEGESISTILADSDLQPIPLTDEILEKNGWFLRRPKVYLLEHDGSILKISVGEDFCTVWLKNFDAKVWLAEIEYIHQLQHILWALGIDDNLKI